MTLSKGDRDIPSPPGRLLLIDEETSVDPNIHNLRGMNPSGTIKPGPRTCEREICAKSAVLSASQTLAQEIVGCHEVDSTRW